MSTAHPRTALAPPKKAGELLDLYFLQARSALLETAAILDRIRRAQGGTEAFDDPRLRNLMAACDLLKDGKGDRAERFLRLFSDPVE
jgi:hypothetical protein